MLIYQRVNQVKSQQIPLDLDQSLLQDGLQLLHTAVGSFQSPLAAQHCLHGGVAMGGGRLVIIF